MLTFQLAGIHIGNDIAVAAGRCRQVKHKRGVQVIQHLRAEVRPGIVAFVHNDHWLQVPQHLNQCRVRCISQHNIIIPEILRKAEQIAVFLVDLTYIAIAAVDTQGAVTHDADRQHFADGIR